jgi:hypothetical protein
MLAWFSLQPLYRVTVWRQLMKRPKSDGDTDSPVLAEFSYWLSYTVISSGIISSVIYYFLGSVGI